jgi:uncharacterized protein (TIGR00266 family)
MQDKVEGAPLPVLEVQLDPGEQVIAEVGEFSWMTDSIEMSTGTGGGVGGRGLMGALKRAAGGSSFLFNTFTATTAPGMVAFAAKLPGSIFPIDVGSGRAYLCHRRGFLAATPGVEVSVALQQSFRGGIFGGEGFILQQIAGSGRAWVELAGHVSAYDLAAGQTMRAHPGHVGLFEASVSFQVQRVPGLANRYLGDDGHHVVILSGPGRIWLQSLPLPLLAGSLAPYLPSGGDGSAASTGFVSGALGGLLRGN